MRYQGRNIRLVAGIHGNERAPVRAMREKGTDFILGNPLAFERGVRFVDQDLNASFGRMNETYEAKRASEILNDLSPNEVVIDFHTTSALGPPFAILTDKKMIPLAERTGLSHAVLMSHNIKEGNALINLRDGISVEMSGYDTNESFQRTLQVIDHLERGERTPLALYEVYGVITETGAYENFVEHPDGFVPVLVGEVAYDFVGLKARKLPTERVVE